jgi:hypothetical protein
MFPIIAHPQNGVFFTFRPPQQRHVAVLSEITCFRQHPLLSLTAKRRFTAFPSVAIRSRDDSELKYSFSQYPLLSLTRKMAYFSTSGSTNNLPLRYIAILDVFAEVSYSAGSTPLAIGRRTHSRRSPGVPGGSGPLKNSVPQNRVFCTFYDTGKLFRP